HDARERRVEQEPRLIAHVNLQREVLRALQREERLAHRVLGPDEREDGAARARTSRHAAFAVRTAQREPELRRQYRRIRRREQAQPRSGERLAIDLRLDLAAFGKARAQKREALDL